MIIKPAHENFFDIHTYKKLKNIEIPASSSEGKIFTILPSKKLMDYVNYEQIEQEYFHRMHLTWTSFYL